MKTTTFKFTYTELNTVCKALQLLKYWDEVHLKRDLLSDEEKEALEKEIETCMFIFNSGFWTIRRGERNHAK